MNLNSKVIAVDFDGTITYPSKYPVTGEINPYAVECLKKIGMKHRLILWTCREGSDLKEAVALCEKHGLTFDSVNEGILEPHSRKIRVDLYIDDKNTLDHVIPWDEIMEGLQCTL